MRKLITIITACLLTGCSSYRVCPAYSETTRTETPIYTINYHDRPE